MIFKQHWKCQGRSKGCYTELSSKMAIWVSRIEPLKIEPREQVVVQWIGHLPCMRPTKVQSQAECRTQVTSENFEVWPQPKANLKKIRIFSGSTKERL